MHHQHDSEDATKDDKTIVEIVENNNHTARTSYDDFLAVKHPILKDLLGRFLLLPPSEKCSINDKDDCCWDQVYYNLQLEHIKYRI